jgi:hypothetical protein
VRHAILGYRGVEPLYVSNVSTMNNNLLKDEEDRIRKVIEAMEAEEIQLVLEGNMAAAGRDWASDLAVNAPNNQIMRKPGILELMSQQTGLQYLSAERHREAMIIRPNCDGHRGLRGCCSEGKCAELREDH